MTRVLAALGLLLAIAGEARAGSLPDDPPEPENLPPPLPTEEKPAPPIHRFVTVTVSPFHALIPFLEVTGELQITPQISGALLAGVGKFLDGNARRHTAQEIGAQGLYYFQPTFRALHVGVEVTYVHSSDTDGATTLTGTSLQLGPFVGYKYIHPTGVTLSAQLGVALAVVEERSPPDNKVTALPILNLNAGWSF